VIETGLITGDAGIDFMRASLGGLHDDLGIGQERPRHRYQIAGALCEQCFGDVGRIDAVRHDHRHLDRGLQSRAQRGKGGARHRGHDGRHPRFVPADAGVEHRHAGGFQRLGDLYGFVPRIAAFHQIDQRDPVHDDKAFAAHRAHPLDDLAREPHPVFDAAAVGVGAPIGARAEELVEQIAFAAHDLDAVIARALSEARAARVVAHGLLQCRRC
jgi:hypothetical protein